MGNDATESGPLPSVLDPQRLSIARWWHDLTEQSSGDHSHRKVLVADDEAMIRTLLQRVISRDIGCHSALVGTGNEVLEHLERETCDVLVTDMLMPGLHGLELISKVRERWPHVDIIVMTGFIEVFPYVEVIRAGANDFIAKPHQPREMEAKLRRLFNERELRERLVLAEAKYRSLFELAVHGEILLKPGTCEIVDTNRAFCELIGRGREAAIGMELFELIDDAARNRLEQALDIFASSGQGSLSDITLLHADGRKLSVDIAISFITVSHERILFLSIRDVTEKQRVVEELTVAVQIDGLTGLSNKRTLLRRLDAFMPGTRSEGGPHTLLFLDIDNFKNCNDTHGHQAGDNVLKSVGRIVRKQIRDGRGDEGFRYGGDEFAILLTATPKDGAAVVAERIRADFEGQGLFGCTLSIGLAEFEKDMTSGQFLEAADSALYQAKAHGKNSIHVL